MQIIRGIDQLKKFLSQTDCSIGCLADTGFLYGASYTDDRVYQQALDVFLILEEKNIPIHTNVIGRMEFIDLVFRKQLTLGAIKTFNSMNPKSSHKSLYDLLKKIRDDDTAIKKLGQSFKIGENQLKKLKEKIEESAGQLGWRQFCSTYAGEMLINEWEILEEDLGLHFIEVLEGQTSALLPKSLYWKDMVKTMGQLGVRGPDAMIINLFQSCALPLLITADKDFEFSNSTDEFFNDKAILILEQTKSNVQLVGDQKL
ncbi:MAG: hypothetical protein J0M15_13390 [Deltaproteobacteria bacterium]|nr:hypothetical protein [Deltaproteobacteria bacterium]